MKQFPFTHITFNLMIIWWACVRCFSMPKINCTLYFTRRVLTFELEILIPLFDFYTNSTTFFYSQFYLIRFFFRLFLSLCLIYNRFTIHTLFWLKFFFHPLRTLAAFRKIIIINRNARSFIGILSIFDFGFVSGETLAVKHSNRSLLNMHTDWTRMFSTIILYAATTVVDSIADTISNVFHLFSV